MSNITIVFPLKRLQDMTSRCRQSEAFPHCIGLLSDWLDQIKASLIFLQFWFAETHHTFTSQRRVYV